MRISSSWTEFRLRLEPRRRGLGAAGMGIKAVIAPDFGDIFYSNCFQNGILPIIVDKEIVGRPCC